MFIETRCRRHTRPSYAVDTLPRTRTSQEARRITAQNDLQEGTDGLGSRDAQAACGFRCLPSKRAPFFQTIRVIAAILRAKVRRAIEGFIPLASRLS